MCSGVQGAVLAVGMRSKLPGKKFSAHGLQPQRKYEGEAHTSQRDSKSMEVKRRKEAKKQNDFCGGKRHIATFQNYRNQLVLGRPRKAWYRLKASFTSCSARWQRTWHVQRYWRAKGAKCTWQRIQKLEQYPLLRHIQRHGATAATTPKYGAKLFVHARAAVRSIYEIDRDGDASANFERPYGAISYWIFENKISSFRKLQDLSNGIFAFKIGLEMTSNEVRKTT